MQAKPAQPIFAPGETIRLGIPQGLNGAPPPPPPETPPGPADLSEEEQVASTTMLPVENASKVVFNYKTKQWERSPTKIEIAKGYFARGVTRIAFWMNEVSAEGVKTRYVGKFLDDDFLRTIVGPVTREMYFNDCMSQVVAGRMAQLYNSQAPPKKILMLPMHIVEMTDRPGKPLMMVEPVLEGEFVKHNNNNGGILSASQTPQAFSHFTYEASNFALVVVDIQGVGEVYTDPQVHSLNQREFGLGNQGVMGMTRFLESHTCCGVCLALGLTRIENGRVTTPWPEETRTAVLSSLNGGSVVTPALDPAAPVVLPSSALDESLPLEVRKAELKKALALPASVQKKLGSETSDQDAATINTDPVKPAPAVPRPVDNYDQLMEAAIAPEGPSHVFTVSPEYGKAPRVFYDGVCDGFHPGMAPPPGVRMPPQGMGMLPPQAMMGMGMGGMPGMGMPGMVGGMNGMSMGGMNGMVAGMNGMNMNGMSMGGMGMMPPQMSPFGMSPAGMMSPFQGGFSGMPPMAYGAGMSMGGMSGVNMSGMSMSGGMINYGGGAMYGAPMMMGATSNSLSPNNGAFKYMGSSPLSSDLSSASSPMSPTGQSGRMVFR